MPWQCSGCLGKTSGNLGRAAIYCLTTSGSFASTAPGGIENLNMSDAKEGFSSKLNESGCSNSSHP